MNILIYKGCFLTSLFVLLSSCATIFTGTTSNIVFNSVPDGAEVKIDGFSIGTTPVDYRIKKSDDPIITFEKGGYKMKYITLQKSFNPISLLNTIFIYAWALDFGLGSFQKFDEKFIKLYLEKK